MIFMKKLGVYIIVAIVILLHGLIWFMLRQEDSPKEENLPPEQEQTPVQPEENAPAQPVVQPAVPPVPSAGKTPVAPVATPPVAQPATPPVAQPATPPAQVSRGTVGPYHKGFFQVTEKELSPAVKKAVAQVRSGLVIDLNTNAILWQKDASSVHPIASLTKLLTATMLMEHLAAHPEQSLQTTMTITSDDRAYFKRNGIKGVFLDTNEVYTLDDFLMCMMICSANDCAYMVGRYLNGGDAKGFPEKMNARAKELGLNNMHFNNANGLPINAASGRQENTGTALEIAYLAVRAMQYPAIMKWAGTPMARLRADKKNPFDVNSTNKLLRGKVPGVTGLKTGFTDGAGYCIALTCEREGKKRMVLLMGVGGSDRGKRRDEIARQLLEWSYTL